jgi:hypothetical protein
MSERAMNMLFRVTLVQNLDSRDPSAVEVIYTYQDDTSRTWGVSADPDKDTTVTLVDCAADLIRQPNVKSRILRAHYPTAPATVDIQISSVQKPSDNR